MMVTIMIAIIILIIMIIVDMLIQKGALRAPMFAYAIFRPAMVYLSNSMPS